MGKTSRSQSKMQQEKSSILARKKLKYQYLQMK